MSGAIRVLLPPTAAHLAASVIEAGCTPVIDATFGRVPAVPDGAWVRIRPGRPAPGTGPVVLAELGAPVPDRPTWLETAVPRDIPAGYAGLILKGREAGGPGGEEDGLVALARCPEPGRVLLDAGVGPVTAAAAAALGAGGILLAEPHLGCPEFALSPAMARRLLLADDEITRTIGGVRASASPTAPVLRRLQAGESPWALQADLWEAGDPNAHLWIAGQGLALAVGLAERFGTLPALLAAYRAAWESWPARIRAAQTVGPLRVAGTTAALAAPGTVASTGGTVGSAVLWQIAAWLDRPVHSPDIKAAAATGRPVSGPAEELDAVRATLPLAPAAPAPPPAPAPPRGTAAVAIVGIGCRFPGGAEGAEGFWNNIVSEVDGIGPVPVERWDPALYFDTDRAAPDKTYASIGGFLRDFHFDSKRFRIPPSVARQVDPVQQITLVCVAEALEDANLRALRRGPGREFPRERTAVILGNSLGGEVSDDYAVRLAWPDVARRLLQQPPFCDLAAPERDKLLADLEVAYKAGLPVIDEDSMPGELANVIAGRIANAFDLGGANFTVDAACASSMAALQTAVKSLQDGESDIVVTGGADRSMNITTYVKFCKIGALSADHSAPFDASANGFVMGEGCGILVLKRLEDAERDDDKIYAVIRGIGASSDGKGKGITAPNIQGQIRALERAYTNAGLQPAQVDLIEAHGTSTVVGDQVEVEALSKVIGPGQRGDRGPIRIGSVKSMIGHLKSAAGAAAVIKAALALHHGTYPPSLNYRKAREGMPLDVIPLKVQDHAEAWPPGPDGLRRAGVSAFGFGGTNFHVVLEGWAGQPLPTSVAKAPPAPQQIRAPQRAAAQPGAQIRAARPAGIGLPEGLWAASGLDQAELLTNLRTLAEGKSVPFHPSAPLRMAAAPRDAEERASQLQRAIKSIEKGSNPDLLRARGVQIEDGPFDGKLCLTFTGQGSQYLDMGLALATAYPIVQETFDEADRILAPTLGRGITDYVRLSAGEDSDAKSEVLRQTEYSQPATLTLDVAILRLLAAYGVAPDMVAGHSLGEYGAAVAAGVMTFEQALLAVSARGREMASIRLDDPGKMAGIATGAANVEGVLAEVDGYVIPANKNCPTQTVIAGASDAVDEACERFRANGVTVYPLPVSHAFHSAIVAPASEPLRGVLTKLGLHAPKRPITTNVTGDYYPTGDDAVPGIIDLLARQISAPVEWTAQLERMYADGARVFVECGPKRALSGFTVSILKRRPHRALYTNHPKRGDVASFRDALAGVIALGLPVRETPLPLAEIDLFAAPQPRRATTQAITAFTELHRSTSTEATPDLRRGIINIVARTSGYQPEELDLDYELEADLGIDTVKQAEVFSVVRQTYGIPADPDFTFSSHRTLRSLIDWAAERTGATRIAVQAADVPPAPPVSSPPTAVDGDVVATFLRQAAETGLQGLDGARFAEALLPAVQGLLTAAFDAARDARPPAVAATPAPPPAAAVTHRLPGQPFPIRPSARIVCTGASVGLPGGTEVFAPDNFLRILEGQGRITPLGDRSEAFLDMGVVRLIKDPQTGQGTFLPVEKVEEVIRLAGTGAGFDLADWGVDARLTEALDVTTRLAFAAGLEALRDAGLPLVRSYKKSATGKRIPQGWGLPEELRDGTGVILGSAFPGLDQLVRHVRQNGRTPEGHFDRRFLFQVLTMGHSQFAQLIGARGPNTALNGACASTTQALALAEDWIRMGRCERVIVLGADDVTSETLLPWIGAGFMAAGAATTHDVVAEAALPFDRRRHGMILGMGAVAMVVEEAQCASARGIVPLAEQIGTTMVNSAFHGTRLDVDHIAAAVRSLVSDVCAAEGITPAQFASQAFFMSHETYTPARGGSAAAEIEALRAAFGPAASQIVVANTKGFTGHPMGAGIEDSVVLKALQYGRIPPIANLSEPDESLGDLTLSRGETGDFRYALRLAAGFGSQLALTVQKRMARGDERVADPVRRLAWLKRVTGFAHVEEHIEDRTLRVVASEQDRPYDLRPDVSPALPEASSSPRAAVDAPAVRPAAAAGSLDYDTVLTDLVTVVALKTGYETDELEPDFELEADLGVDTVKQAEILGELTERYGVERDDSFRIADYPTLAALAGYLMGAAGGAGAHLIASTSDPAPSRVAPNDIAPIGAAAAAPSGETLAQLVALVAEKTGYEPDELEPGFELEADLGIDTVKQAEILGDLTERYGLEQDETFRLSDFPTIEALAGYVDARRGGEGAPTLAAGQTAAAAAAPAVDVPAAAAPAPAGDTGETLAALIAVVAEKTGYEPDELDPTFELEADLGVDTVKQAEILSSLQDDLQLPPDDDFRPADYPTLEDLAGYLHTRRSAQATATAEPSAAPEPDAERVPTQEEQEEQADTAPEREPRAPVHAPLPSTFRVRQVVLEDAPFSAPSSLRGVAVHVSGSTDYAAALRSEITERGGSLQAPFRVVIDTADDVLAALALAKKLDADSRPELWVAATRLGGVDAIDPGMVRAVADGAAAGFAKSIGQEWSETRARVIDVAPETDDAGAASALCDELFGPGNEVFIDQMGTRRELKLRQVDPPEPGTLDGEPVAILTGGARGITARIAEELAKRGPVHLALVGRSAVPTEPLDEAAEKARIKAELKAAGERVTPRRVDDALKPLRKGEEARATIARLRSLGASVSYHRADLADQDDARRLVGEITDTVGPVTLLVHGAGVEESRLLPDKDASAFHRVFDGKALGGRALLEAIPDEAFAVTMGSVAGRFGNAGQVDYAAANDALARCCHGRPLSLHVDWTAWDDVGMAVRGGMRNLLEGRGVDLLPADAGACLLVDLIASQTAGELVVAGRLGDFEAGPDHAMLDSLDVIDGMATGTYAISRASDPWLDDHAIEGTAVLPGVAGIELMAAVSAALFGGAQFAGVRNVQFTSPVKVHHDQTITLVIEAERVRAGEARARLTSVRTLRTGRVRRVEHFASTVLFSSDGSTTTGLPSAFLPDETIEKAEIYRRFFHGPRFQVLESVLGISEDGLFGEGVARPLLDGLVTDPLALEAAFQAAGLHRMIVSNTMGLPMGINEMVVLSRPAPDAVLSLMVRLEGEQYQVDVDGIDGPVLRLRGFTMIELGPVPDGDRFPVPDEGRPTCFPSASPSRRTGTGPVVAEANADEDTQGWLTADELGELRARGTERRVRDRVAGRIAAKRALSSLTGVEPLQIRVWSEHSGEPRAEVPGHPSARVSLSHRDGRAVAVAVDAGYVGVDLERVEERPPSFAEAWFDADERRVIAGDPERQTIAWALKEAVLKLVGTGLAASPHEVKVRRVGAGDAEVDVTGEVAAALARRGSGAPLRITWAAVGADEVVVTVRTAA